MIEFIYYYGFEHKSCRVLALRHRLRGAAGPLFIAVALGRVGFLVKKFHRLASYPHPSVVNGAEPAAFSHPLREGGKG